MNIQSRSRRILNPLRSYQTIEEAGDFLYSLRERASIHGAKPLGIYSNVPGESKGTILVTDLGVFLDFEDEVQFVEYKNIERVDVVAGGKMIGSSSESEKVEADGLLVILEKGGSVLLPVRNGNGKYRDAFEFLRFMNRAMEDSTSSVVVH